MTNFLYRRFLGSFNLRSSYFILALLLWPVSLIITIKYFIDGNYDLWVAIPGAASIIGLAIMITDKFIERRKL